MDFNRPTLKQKRVVDALVEGGGSYTYADALRKAGYGKSSVKTPTKVTKSQGFRQLCEEAGLTHGLIVNSLVEDIRSKPKRRLGELKLGAEITGLTRGDNITAVQRKRNSDKDEYS